MATIVFQAAGAVLGSALGPFGAIAGRAIGALAGSMVDSRVLGRGGSTVIGQHLATARVGGAEEGTAIPRVYGTSRIGGTLIWATRFEEAVIKERSGGKAGGATTESFAYYGNFALGICEGPVAAIRRVWADGRELDLTDIDMRFYPGDDEQLADPLIEAKQGEGNAPTYRGLCYVVFEHLPLDVFGNRIPVFQFEVLKPTGKLERQIRAMTIIPGATEHGLCPYPVTESPGRGAQRIINRNSLTHASDWDASMDELMALCPNLERVALVVTWFGSDLRADACRIRPGVETPVRDDESAPWKVSGIERAAAYVVSQHDGGPAYGGTPNDAGLMAAIADLKRRGLEVFLYPFIMMDIPDGNGLPDPYGASGQAVYPWRGRITCFPAPEMAGSPDRTGAARAAVEAFLGSAEVHQFSASSSGISFSGEDEGYRRLILHYAHLAAAAGGVDGFIIGSELRGLTAIRDQNDDFPFVEGLIELAGDVRAIVGGQTALTYGADWSEYFGYHPADGSGNVYFNLDPLWANGNITAVGIDNYMPLSDWRYDDLGAANPDGFVVGEDVAGLKAQITSGEGFDWYYASENDRAGRIRSAITDGAADKPWVFRYKDIQSWWGNRHFNRIAGVESSEPTAWLPGQKPVWFTELGCPAVDKGACQPNVFADPKSVESAFPYFSSGARSDVEQRRFLEAHLDWWDSGDTPSGMVDPGHVFLWCWDIRPYPAFPQDRELWSDGDNWRTGHWLNGRLGGTTLPDMVAALLADHGFDDWDVSSLSGDLTGYVQADTESARNLLEPLLGIYSADCIDRAGTLTFRSRLRASLPSVTVDLVADVDEGGMWRETRQHESDLAGETVVSYSDIACDYEQASARSQRIVASNDRVLRYGLPVVLPETTALQLAGNLLRENRIAVRQLRFDLPPQARAFDVGDVINLRDGPSGHFMIERLEASRTISVEARSFSPLTGRAFLQPGRAVSNEPVASGYAPRIMLMDLANYDGGPAEDYARIAIFATPWKRAFVSSSATSEGYAVNTIVEQPAATASLVSSLAPGISGRFDYSDAVEIRLDFGGLSSATKTAVLAGANRLAVKSENGAFEILSFLEAEEFSPGRWRLRGLLRGLYGTEDAMASGAETGADAVILNAAVRPLGVAAEQAVLARNYIVETAFGKIAPGMPHMFSGGLRAQTPLSPVHLRTRRKGNGDLYLSWVRRSRVDADDWEASDIPLDEDDEGYRLQFYHADSLVRQVDLAVPEYLYPHDQQAADFGATAGELTVSVCQRGRKVPLGLKLTANIPIN